MKGAAMKLSRIAALTVVLLLATTIRHTPAVTTTTVKAKVAVAQTHGPCVLINGVWICD